MDTLDEYQAWVVEEIIPAAETYAEEFFEQFAACLDERASELLAKLETEEGRAWTHDMTIPVINAIILHNVGARAKAAETGWRRLYRSGLAKHFQART